MFKLLHPCLYALQDEDQSWIKGPPTDSAEPCRKLLKGKLRICTPTRVSSNCHKLVGCAPPGDHASALPGVSLL